MIILFIVGLLLGAVSVIFALQNVAVITVTFFSWHVTGSLALILLLAIISGIVIALLMVLPELFSNYFKNRSLIKENAKLVDEIAKQKTLTAFAKTTPPTAEDIRRIEQGAIAS